MRGIAKLLFGDDAARLLDLFTADGEERRMAERVRRSGEWCGSTPGRGTAGRQVFDAMPGPRPGWTERRIVIREFRDR